MATSIFVRVRIDTIREIDGDDLLAESIEEMLSDCSLEEFDAYYEVVEDPVNG